MTLRICLFYRFLSSIKNNHYGYYFSQYIVQYIDYKPKPAKSTVIRIRSVRAKQSKYFVCCSRKCIKHKQFNNEYEHAIERENNYTFPKTLKLFRVYCIWSMVAIIGKKDCCRSISYYFRQNLRKIVCSSCSRESPIKGEDCYVGAICKDVYNSKYFLHIINLFLFICKRVYQNTKQLIDFVPHSS